MIKKFKRVSLRAKKQPKKCGICGAEYTKEGRRGCASVAACMSEERQYREFSRPQYYVE